MISNEMKIFIARKNFRFIHTVKHACDFIQTTPDAMCNYF